MGSWSGRCCGWVDDSHLIEWEVPLDEGNCASADGAMPNHADFWDVTVFLERFNDTKCYMFLGNNNEVL